MNYFCTCVAALSLQLDSILKVFSNLNKRVFFIADEDEFLACECGSDGSEGFAHSILQLNTGLYNNRTDTYLSLPFMIVSDMMDIIICSEGKRHWNSKEPAQEVLLQISDLGQVFGMLHFTG